MAASHKQAPVAKTQGYAKRERAERLTGGGTTGNERLTTVVGATPIVLLAVIGLTILRIHPLLSVHLFVGTLLVPPVALKLSSTGYRFFRYYTGNRRDREKGPPELALVAGVVLAILVIPEFGPWLNGRIGLFHHH
jgi:hypothetical protein